MLQCNVTFLGQLGSSPRRYRSDTTMEMRMVRLSFVRSLVLAVTLFAASAASSAAVFVSVSVAPPALPVYEQPIAPGPGFIWAPGYWAWGPEGFYWVPGTWVPAPYVGALWTPGYWGWDGAFYIWHAGYWGPRVGYYGGINYGFGYFGVGYVGGYWSHGAFYYNRAVNHVDVARIHNTYTRNVVVNNTNVSRVSYNGGAGGIVARPTREELLAETDRHRTWTPTQANHERAAAQDRRQLASLNNGVPAMRATSRPSAFRGQNADMARGGPGAQQGSHVNRGGAPRARFEQGGPPPSAGGHPQEFARGQNAPRSQGMGPQGQGERPHPQGQGEKGHPQGERGGRGGEHQEEHHR
jgi:hypothetical protein